MSEYMSDEVEETIAEVLMVISDVGIGDLSGEIDLPEEEGPLAALCIGVNEMLRALRTARSETEAYQQELNTRLATIEKQATVIRTLSSPIMEIWEGVLMLPLIGEMQSSRAQLIMEDLLGRVASTQARFVVVDLTGVEVIDTRAVAHLLEVIGATSLLGAECVLTGISPAVAQSVVKLTGGRLPVPSLRTVRDGLRRCVAVLDREARAEQP